MWFSSRSCSGSALPLLELSVELLDPADVCHIGIAHFAQLRDGFPAPGSALAVDEERGGFVVQEIFRVPDLVEGDVAASADMAGAVLLFGADIDQDGSLCGPAAVYFFVDLNSFKNIHK